MENDKKIISLDDTEYELLKEDIVGGNNFYMAAMVGDNRPVSYTHLLIPPFFMPHIRGYVYDSK